MSITRPFRALSELINQLHSSLDELERGNLTIEEIAPLLEDARELHERLVILQYMTHTKQPHQGTAITTKEIKAEVQVEESIIESKISEAIDAGAVDRMDKGKEKKGVKLNFNLFSSPEPEPVNQINLLDAIAKEVPAHSDEATSESEIEVAITVVQQPETNIHQPHSINEVIAKVSEKLSLNDKLADGSAHPSLAAKLSRKPIKDLNEEIGLNQKFLFMNDLFGGENGLYKEAITTINNFSTHEQAIELLDQLKAQYNWDMESISVTKFIDLVERKFLT
jgi:hypothetical protein